MKTLEDLWDCFPPVVLPSNLALKPISMNRCTNRCSAFFGKFSLLGEKCVGDYSVFIGRSSFIEAFQAKALDTETL